MPAFRRFGGKNWEAFHKQAAKFTTSEQRSQDEADNRIGATEFN